ncbi:MAG: Hsp70 family protein [Thermoguttaceae bacterium]|nr:Hsp70 family protein [Thermoguttaceae bacterium]
MNYSNTPAIGIDLGTTFSAVARLDASGTVSTLLNAEGDRITPSVALFEGGQAIVGKEALKAISTEANSIALCAKRDMGSKVFHQAIENKQYPPEVIEAFILNKLRRDAEAQVGPVSKVVITVPAYFDEVRRKATQDAGYMAGFEVLDIINEPTAAALAFGYQHGILGENSTPENVLVYDLGGGTFDVTIMRMCGNEFTTLATDGDVQLGGFDWDNRLVDHVADKFVSEFYADPREDICARGKLWRECEDAKRTLSARSKVTITCDYQGFSRRFEVTRDEFMQMTQDLVDRTRFTTVQTLHAAGLEWSDISRVLLVGGSSRMPMVRDMLRQVSGQEPDASAAADEAVAMGAAIHAGQILSQNAGDPPSFKIRNVNSHSLGVIGMDPATRLPRVGVLIPRNTKLPVRVRRKFKTQKANQRSLLVQIVEGESSSPDNCTFIGNCKIPNFPPNLPAVTEVHVIFQYMPDGRLKVDVQIPDANAEVSQEFNRENNLSKTLLDGWRQYISGEAPTDYQ